MGLIPGCCNCYVEVPSPVGASKHNNRRQMQAVCHIVAGLAEFAAFCGDAAAVAKQRRFTAERHRHKRRHGAEREQEHMG
jgi:hypothetical protein